MTGEQEPVQVLTSLWRQAREEERKDAAAQIEREQELVQRLAEALSSQAS